MTAIPPDDATARRDLGLLISGNAVSALGNAVYLIAVTLLLVELTGSALVLGLFQFLALAPGLLLSPIAGVVVDRYPRRRVIIVSDVYRGVIMLLAGVALAVPGLRNAWFVLSVAFLSGIGQALFVPAVHALLPALVPSSSLQTATGLRVASSQIANLSGNAIGGALFVLLGAPMLFVLNGVSFLASAVQELFIRGGRERIATARTGSVMAMARAGLRTVVRDPSLRTLLWSQAGLYLISPVLVLSLPFLLIDELGLTQAALGYYLALALAGGIAAFAVLRRFDVQAMLDLPVVGGAYLILAVSFAAAGLLPGAVVLAVVALFAGAAAGSVYLFTTTWIQIRTESRMHGRLFAVTEAANSAFAPLGYLTVGAVLELLGSGQRWALFLFASSAALAWGLRCLRRGAARRKRSSV